MATRLAFLALATAALAACEQDRSITSPAASFTTSLEAQRAGGDDGRRAADGTLGAAGTVATGGTGTGAALGSQGAVALSDDGRWLFAVNAGSNDVSVFAARGAELTLASRTASGGTLPISVTVHRNLLYVYAVDANGAAGARTSFTSAGGTPFGFAFGQHDVLLVSEAAAPGSASSYILGRGGDLAVVSSAVLTHQGAPCWAVVTNDGRLGFTGNGSGSVSGFSVTPRGRIRLIDANGASAVISGGVNDIALNGNSRYLYVLGTGGSPTIHPFRIERDGHLTPLEPIGGLPAGTRGLAAF